MSGKQRLEFWYSTGHGGRNAIAEAVYRRSLNCVEMQPDRERT